MFDGQLGEANYIRLDLFPAAVYLESGETPSRLLTDRARVVVTDADFYMFEDTPTGPATTLAGAVFDASGDNRSGYRIEMEDGNIYTFSRSQGCGCGSRLRGFIPFPGVAYSQMIGR